MEKCTMSYLWRRMNCGYQIILFFVSPTFFVAFLSFRFNLVASSFYGVPSQRRTKEEERNSPSSYYPQMLGQARS